MFMNLHSENCTYCELVLWSAESTHIPSLQFCSCPINRLCFIGRMSEGHSYLLRTGIWLAGRSDAPPPPAPPLRLGEPVGLPVPSAPASVTVPEGHWTDKLQEHTKYDSAALKKEGRRYKPAWQETGGPPGRGKLRDRLTVTATTSTSLRPHAPANRASCACAISMQPINPV